MSPTALLAQVPYPEEVPCASWCRSYHPARCAAIPSHLVAVSCLSLNRRWIHPCRIADKCFAVAEGYACPICKLSFGERHRGEPKEESIL